MQHASLMIKTDCLLFNSDFQTVTGLWLASEPFIRIDKNSSLKLIVETLFEVLNSSRVGILHPTDWTGSTKAYVHSMGYKSLKKLYEDAKSLTISKEGSVIEFFPYRVEFERSKKYFAGIPNSSVKVDSSESVERIYAALMEAISRCE